MEERLVDVLDRNGQILHTYPVTLDDAGEAIGDAEFMEKALAAAAHGQLVPDHELEHLTAQMHRAQAGQLQPYGDAVRTDSETKDGLEQAVRELAYSLWEQEGRPDGRAEEYWYRALEEHLRGRAYVLWQQEGSAEGTADANWEEIRRFQSL